MASFIRMTQRLKHLSHQSRQIMQHKEQIRTLSLTEAQLEEAFQKQDERIQAFAATFEERME